MEHPGPLHAVYLLRGMSITAGRLLRLQSWDADGRGGARITRVIL